MLCNFAPATLSQFATQVDTAMLLALEVGGVHQLLQGHFVPEDSHPIWEHVCLTVISLCIINQSHDLMQHKATKMDYYQVTLIYLDNLRAWVSPWIT